MSDKKSVSLVLSSGGARGLAHIGAIRCLEDLGYQIQTVSGSSMGALVGGIYAAGQLEEYETWVRALRRSDIVQLMDFGLWSGAGLLKGDRIIEALRELVGEHNIEELPVGFTAVATDLHRKREVWLKEGSLFDAVRASIAIPMVFTPVQRGSQLLVDGGVLNPLPIAPTLNHSTDLTVAVDVNCSNFIELPKSTVETQMPDIESETDESTRNAVAAFVSRWFSPSKKQEEKSDKGVIEIMMDSMDAMQVSISRLKSSAYSPDVLVSIPGNICHVFEFERAGEMIDIGYQTTLESLNQRLSD
jgi:NTE family protein